MSTINENVKNVKVNEYSIKNNVKKIVKRNDLIAIEGPLSIYINNTCYSTLFHSPSLEEELVIGHLLSEGTITSTSQIEEISKEIDGKIKVTLNKTYLKETSDRSKDIQDSEPVKIHSKKKIKARVIFNVLKLIDRSAKSFKLTGSFHAAALCDYDGKLVAFAEDISRHNTVDKVIGIAAKKYELSNVFLALTGRLSRNIVSKAEKNKISIIASRGAVTDSALSLAKKANITLLGFVRNERMNIYSLPERIL